jgi:predicted FMN-binding regulatory protein PaiB
VTAGLPCGTLGWSRRVHIKEAFRVDDVGEEAREMADQVVPFRLRAEPWHLEAKLSQDKPAEERARVLAGLEAPVPYANAALAAAMREAGR